MADPCKVASAKEENPLRAVNFLKSRDDSVTRNSLVPTSNFGGRGRTWTGCHRRSVGRYHVSDVRRTIRPHSDPDLLR
jgi:hypothetical protein